MRTALYTSFLPLGGSLGLKQLHSLGTGLGQAMWTCLPRRRQETTQNIHARLGVDLGTAQDLAKKSFIHSAQAFLEIFHTRYMDPRFLASRVEFENPDFFAAACSSSRPTLVATAHLGSWELLVGLMNAGVAKKTCQVIVRLPKDQALASMIRHMRSQPGIDILGHRDAATSVLSYLRQNGLSAFLVDHNCQRAEAVFLPFLGKTAAVNKGPALLALRSKALVWPLFLLRLPQGKFRLVTLPPLDTITLVGDRQERIVEICRFYTQAVEQMVLRYPEQWFWMHRRWKTQP